MSIAVYSKGTDVFTLQTSQPGIGELIWVDPHLHRVVCSLEHFVGVLVIRVLPCHISVGAIETQRMCYTGFGHDYVNTIHCTARSAKRYTSAHGAGRL